MIPMRYLVCGKAMAEVKSVNSFRNCKEDVCTNNSAKKLGNDIGENMILFKFSKGPKTDGNCWIEMASRDGSKNISEHDECHAECKRNSKCSYRRTCQNGTAAPDKNQDHCTNKLC